MEYIKYLPVLGSIKQIDSLLTQNIDRTVIYKDESNYFCIVVDIGIIAFLKNRPEAVILFGADAIIRTAFIIKNFAFSADKNTDMENAAKNADYKTQRNATEKSNPYVPNKNDSSASKLKNTLSRHAPPHNFYSKVPPGEIKEQHTSELARQGFYKF